MATKGIYKRGNIFWIRYAGLDGKIVMESSRSTKFREAEALLIRRRQSIKEGKTPEAIKIKNHTFRELAEQYGIWCQRQRSYKSKKFLIHQLKDAFGSYPLRRINNMVLEQFQTQRLEKGRRLQKENEPAKGNKPATINRLLATMSHMYTKAVEWNMVEKEVAERLKKVKQLEENNRRLRYLAKDECRALINACNIHLRPIVITALNTGMRKQEILQLTWDRVDLKHGFILLEITKNGQRREVPINATLRSTLQSITRRIDVPHVFYKPKTGKPYQEVKKSFSTACKKASIKDFVFHDLRHTFASQLVMAGVDLTTVKELLGHKTLTMTLRYAHLAPSHKVKAVDILDNVLSQSEISIAQLK